MIAIFMIILIVVGIIALWFNIWNNKNPVGKGKDTTIYQSLNKQYMEDKKQTDRVLKMLNNKSVVK